MSWKFDKYDKGAYDEVNTCPISLEVKQIKLKIDCLKPIVTPFKTIWRTSNLKSALDAFLWFTYTSMHILKEIQKYLNFHLI